MINEEFLRDISELSLATVRKDLSHFSKKELHEVSDYFRYKVLPTLKFFISYNHTLIALPNIPKSLMMGREARNMGGIDPNAKAPIIKSSELKFGTVDSKGSFVSISTN